MSASEIYHGEFFKGYRKGEANESFQITRDQFVADRKADVRGTANPSVMNNPILDFPGWPRRSLGVECLNSLWKCGKPFLSLGVVLQSFWCYVHKASRRARRLHSWRARGWLRSRFLHLQW